MKHCRIFLGFIAFVALTTGCSLDTKPLFSVRDRINFPSANDAGEATSGAGGAAGKDVADAAVAGSGGAAGAAGAGGNPAAGSGGAAGAAGSGGKPSAGGGGTGGAGGAAGAAGSAGAGGMNGTAGAGGSGGTGGPTSTCGDGKIEGGEECDDGNTVSETCSYGQQTCTICSSTCRSINGVTSYCGNGSVDAANGEQCDDGNGFTEACAYGQMSCSVCNSSCKTAAGATSYCGNGAVDGDEQCDDGNTATEACSYGQTSCTVCDATCKSVAGATKYCGNGTTESGNGEQCDDGNTTTESCAYGVMSCTVCNASCKNAAGATKYCGNGSTDSGNGEQCDDGNTTTEVCTYGQTSCTVCNSTCKSVAGATKYCGNGTTESGNGEQCDDGNTTTESCPAGQAGCTVCNASCKQVTGASRYTAQAFSMSNAYYMTVDNSGTTCDASSLGDMSGHEPAESGTFPVAVFLVGSYASFTHSLALTFTQRMAARGFIAASVEYINDGYPASCDIMQAKANCIFGSGSANSAIAKLCAQPKADCSKGVVAAGINQGANLASLAKNYDSRARAAYVMGDSLGMGNGSPDLTSCLQASATTFSANQMRAVSGEQDMYSGNSVANVRSLLITMTGRSCGSTVFDCLQSDGSGWFIVRSSDTVDGTADHCYMLATNCLSSSLDANYETGSGSWVLDANVDWLTSQVSP